MRMYGGDAVVPSRWITIKAEGGYFTTDNPLADDYVLYMIELERQHGELLAAGGYAGEHVTRQQSIGRFAPDRGMTKAFTGRAAYTFDPNRSAAVEAAVRADLDGVYLKPKSRGARRSLADDGRVCRAWWRLRQLPWQVPAQLPPGAERPL